MDGLRVVGAGLGRTGTMSLKLALTRLLGGPCYHMAEVVQHPPHIERWTAAARGESVDWHALFEGFVAAVDWPVAAFWEEISAAFPDATIVLSTREPESWWKSASDTIFRSESVKNREGPFGDMIHAMLAARFTPHIEDRAACLLAFAEANAHVRATAPRARLVEWTTKDGWAPLCRALGVPVPDEPFPHANTTDEFRARVAKGQLVGDNR